MVFFTDVKVSPCNDDQCSFILQVVTTTKMLAFSGGLYCVTVCDIFIQTLHDDNLQ